MSGEQAKPQPAAGQVWRSDDGNGCTFDITIGAVAGGFVWPAVGHHESIRALEESRWSCIGLATPAGRVMVGERRQREPYQPGVVDTIVDSVMVHMTGDNAPLARAAKDAIREPTPYDRIKIGSVEIPSNLKVDFEKATRAVEEAFAAKYGAMPMANIRDLLAVNDRRARDGLPALAALGPGVAALSLPPARIAVEAEDLPERWARWGLP